MRTTSNSSTTKLEANDNTMNTVQEHISPYFSVSQTKYGGRGCFANLEIPCGTQIHYCPRPIGYTVSRCFKKEVCYWCFKYDYGTIMKSKITGDLGGNSNKNACSLHFCSDACAQSYREADADGLLTRNLLEAERNYLLGLKQPADEWKEPTGSVDDAIAAAWSSAEKWHEELDAGKQSKGRAQNRNVAVVPRIDEGDFSEAIYVIHVAFNTFQNQMKASSFEYDTADLAAKMKLELIMFNSLQSTEIEKYHRYPYLIESFVKIYKFLKLTCSWELQPYITPQNVRLIIGRNLPNAFGIWSHTKSPTEDKEYLGFAVYPSASLFNHSCEPNIKKIRMKNDLRFVALRDIQKGEELCISYGNHQDEDVDERQKQLSEWFFTCSCAKCTRELTLR
ncbi:uncharacterized protein LODBEIA_P28110 [Lodderomyces beijingensis]|uniref:SET domain-containing protein n=1 Tax=Lodderomyces beijingensis TaxID=1775926 RepID=A0ABP0ZMK6_9ASCO